MKKPLILFEPFISREAVAFGHQVLEKNLFPYGTLVTKLEQEIRSRWSVERPIVVSSGTAALHLAFELLRLKPGDEIITTAMTCVATNLPVLQAGGKLVFADIDPGTGNIDPTDVRKRITDRTRAILVVHFNGLPCDLDEIRTLADERGLVLIEDAAQAVGASYRGRAVGRDGRFGCFSFGRSKHIAAGMGGLLIARDEMDYSEALDLRLFGFDHRDPWPHEGHSATVLTKLGYRYDLDNLNAAAILGNVPYLDKLVRRRQELADRYLRGLANVPGLRLFRSVGDRTHAYWTFMIHVEKREEFTRRLADEGIQTWIIFARNDRYQLFGGLRSDLPQLDQFEKTFTALPCHNRMTLRDVDRVIQTIRKGW